MFIGHFAVGLASKRVAPRASLGVLMAAPNLLDLLWPVFLLLGWEQVRIDPGNTAFTPLDFVSYPISHSLLTACGWGALFVLLYWVRPRYTRGAFVIGLGVVSHWVLDFITHSPDMPLYPGGPKFGLGLWNSVPATVSVELGMYVVGAWLYLSMTRARDRTGAFAMWAFLAFGLVSYVANILGPPPPSTRAIAFVTLTLWLVPVWAWWIDRHREVKPAVQA
jgi:LexA-binding, inner membrane-associated putative hydrolase